MPTQQELLPHLFRTEYRKIVSVLCKLFGIEYIAIAEDIVSDTFLLAAELWGLKGLPPNPVAWLYTVAKNKTKDYLKRDNLFTGKIAARLKQDFKDNEEEILIDLSNQNINDSQLQMMIAICHPILPVETQIGLSLNILCGFGADEIADAFLTNRETIYKRLARGKEKLKAEKITIELPSQAAITERLGTVLTTLYLLFNEGYYSASQNTKLRQELCVEAMRLNYLLVENEATNLPKANALLSLMCFHASRFEARTSEAGEMVLYDDQDTKLWNEELVSKGEYYLNLASKGQQISKYHLEAAIAYWHTHKEDSHEKWESILQLYNQLLLIEYSPMAALNRTYALAKANGKAQAIAEAEKLQLQDNRFYHSLLGHLYTGVDNEKAVLHFQQALGMAKEESDRKVILKNMEKLEG